MSPEITNALQKIPTTNNICIIDEQVQKSAQIQDAKKVAIDLALRLCSKIQKTDVTLASLDADIVEITPGALINASELLKSKKTEFPYPVASIDYKYDRRLQKRFPALYHYLKLIERISKFNRIFAQEQKKKDLPLWVPQSDTNIKGGFYVMESETIFAVGGVFPMHDNFEDLSLTKLLDFIAKQFGYKRKPCN